MLITGAIIYLLSMTMEMSVFVTNMASMIGIGVAVDYSLFVLARYRQEISAGADPDQARATALATSGVAVIFSGATVVTALAGLYLVHAAAIRSMALGAIVVVTVSVLAAATLLPSIISLLGDRAHTRGTRVQLWMIGAADAESPTRLLGELDRACDTSSRFDAADGGDRDAGAGDTSIAPATPDGALRQFPKGNETLRGFQDAARR